MNTSGADGLTGSTGSLRTARNAVAVAGAAAGRAGACTAAALFGGSPERTLRSTAMRAAATITPATTRTGRLCAAEGRAHGGFGDTEATIGNTETRDGWGVGSTAGPAGVQAATGGIADDDDAAAGGMVA
jgi:hypothetical protein